MDNIERPTKIIYDKVIGFKTEMVEYISTSKDSILYALGIGFSEEQLNKAHFKYTYEFDENFTAFPSQSCVIALKDSFDVMSKCPGLPEINPMGVLHGEEWAEYVSPLPSNNTPLVYQSEIVDLDDKGKGTVICLQTKIFTKGDNKLVSIVHANIFARGLKGEGIKAKGPLLRGLPKLPKTDCFKEITMKTHVNQAFLYRIGGNDPNPLHIDPDFAGVGGFEKPILHGLCTYGITMRAAFELFCGGDETKIKSFNTRFTAHVFPGESLNIKFWKNGANSLIVVAFNVERKTQILIGEMTFQNAGF